MDKRNSTLLMFGAVAILALGAAGVGFWYFQDEPGETIRAPEQDNRTVPAEAVPAEAREAAAPDQRPDAARKIRRLRGKEQRRKLLDGIAAARALRERIARERALADEEDPGGPDGAGTLSKQTIRDAVDAVIEDVKHCYEDQLKLTPDLGGKLVVSFEIVAEEGAGGIVDQAEIGDDSDEAMRESRELSQCIVDTIYTLELPEPEGGGVVEVSYPFVMRPTAPEHE